MKTKREHQVHQGMGERSKRTGMTRDGVETVEFEVEIAQLRKARCGEEVPDYEAAHHAQLHGVVNFTLGQFHSGQLVSINQYENLWTDCSITG